MSREVDREIQEVMEEVADEMDMDLSKIDIPEKSLRNLFESLDDSTFRKGVKQTFKQLKD